MQRIRRAVGRAAWDEMPARFRRSALRRQVLGAALTEDLDIHIGRVRPCEWLRELVEGPAFTREDFEDACRQLEAGSGPLYILDEVP